MSLARRLAEQSEACSVPVGCFRFGVWVYGSFGCSFGAHCVYGVLWDFLCLVLRFKVCKFGV